MLNRFTVSQYKQFHKLKSLRRACKKMEESTNEPYRIVEWYNNSRTLCIIYKDDVIEMRKHAEYEMRKLIQEVMNKRSYHIERPKSYEEINAELIQNCRRAIEILERVESAIKDE